MPIPAALLDLDRQLVTLAGQVQVLSRLSWPEQAVAPLAEALRRGERPALPSAPPVTDLDGEVPKQLEHLAAAADTGHPAGAFLAATAESYAAAARMVAAAGTPRFRELTREIYGGPRDALASDNPRTHLDFARDIVDETEELDEPTRQSAQDFCVTAQSIVEDLNRRIVEVFRPGEVRVVVDPALSAKAAAGATRIRIRGQTCYSTFDIEQLLQHEAFVHAATARNGLDQPQLTALGRGAPRTTATQEGLATFAELVTGTMDLTRLRRIALRVCAVDLAEQGADLVDVSLFFLEKGQSPFEAAHSAVRVFRGGDPRGGVAFTKDTVYLRGLVSVHAFLHRAIVERAPERIPRLFAGRLTLHDVERLEELFVAGDLVAGPRLPPWAQKLPSLAASLMFTRLAMLERRGPASAPAP